MEYADGLENQNNPKEFAEGDAAFQHGKTISENPYPFDTPEFHAWHEGWNEAFSKEVNG